MIRFIRSLLLVCSKHLMTMSRRSPGLILRSTLRRCMMASRGSSSSQVARWARRRARSTESFAIRLPRRATPHGPAREAAAARPVGVPRDRPGPWPMATSARSPAMGTDGRSVAAPPAVRPPAGRSPSPQARRGPPAPRHPPRPPAPPCPEGPGGRAGDGRGGLALGELPRADPAGHACRT